MKLTLQQLQEFDERGYLFLPECFSEEEVAALRSEADMIYASNRQEVWREKSGAPRTAFAAHTYNEAFRLLGAHPRLIGPVEQLLGEKLYMHRSRSTPKQHSKARCGNGTRTTALGPATTACRSRAR